MAWDEVHLRGYPRAGYEWVEAPIAPEWATGYYDYDRGLALVADSTRTSDAGSYYQIVSTRETNPGWTRRTLQSNYASRVAMNVTTFELDQSVATLNTGQIAAVTEVVKAWDRVSRGPQEPNDSSPTFVSENRTTSMHEVAHAFLHYAHVVAPLDPTVGVTTDTAASDWYQAWLLWTFRAVAHGASLLEVLQAFDRRVGVLRTCVRPPPTQILQRVQTTLRRISHSLRRHAPPPFRCEQHPRRGIEHDVTPANSRILGVTHNTEGPVKLALLFSGTCIRIYAANQQVIDTVRELSDVQWRDFQTCAAVLDTSLEVGRPSRRAERVHGSRAALFEMRVTPPGRSGPHVRFLYIARERDLLCVRGFIKKQRRIARKDIDLADKASLELDRPEEHPPQRRDAPGLRAGTPVRGVR